MIDMSSENHLNRIIHQYLSKLLITDKDYRVYSLGCCFCEKHSKM